MAMRLSKSAVGKKEADAVSDIIINCGYLVWASMWVSLRKRLKHTLAILPTVQFV